MRSKRFAGMDEGCRKMPTKNAETQIWLPGTEVDFSLLHRLLCFCFFLLLLQSTYSF